MIKSPLARRINKAIQPLLLLSVLGQALPVNALQSDLPDIGTASLSYLPLEKEREYGDAYMRQLRATMPMVYDPLINEYVNSLGQRLLRNADSVNFPFNFFVVNNKEINAFAFFGGYVGVHTGLFHYAESESELASVFAHEIAHVTQRHLARMMEAQVKSTPATIAATVGSIMLAIISPQAGFAGLSGSMAAAQQSSINYTRKHEAEADRVGMRTMVAAGFDPYAMPGFFGKLASKYRFSSKPPEMLLTHPLPESRISDSRNRATQYTQRYVADSLAFQLTRTRVQVRYGVEPLQVMANKFKKAMASSQRLTKEAAQYGYALSLLEQNQLPEARQHINQLLEHDPENLFYVDTATDIDLAAGKLDSAIARLEHLYQYMPNNSVVSLNLASALNKKKRFEQSLTILERYRREHPNSFLAYSMLQEAYEGNRQPAMRHVARAEQLALLGGFEQAINELRKAYPLLHDNLIEQSKVEARINQFKTSIVKLEQLSS